MSSIKANHHEIMIVWIPRDRVKELLITVLHVKCFYI